MDVVLDTNIVRQDFLMNSSHFRVLFDYLEKTNSSVVVPQIVYQELASVYRRELRRFLDQYGKAEASLQRLLVETRFDKPKLTVEDELDKYLAFVKKKLGLTDKKIVPYKDHYLPEVVRRATGRIKPCSDKGEEFRDALLWLTILDIARQRTDKMLAFISGNTREFASEEGTLHPCLVEEAEGEGLKILYFRSISDFVKEHATRIDYITKEWLLSASIVDSVSKHVLKAFEDWGQAQLTRWAERRGKQTSGYAVPCSVSLEIEDFYVYEMTDGSVFVQAQCVGELEVEFEVEFDEDEPEDWGRGTATRYYYPEVEVIAGITVAKREIQDVEIVDWLVV